LNCVLGTRHDCVINRATTHQSVKASVNCKKQEVKPQIRFMAKTYVDPHHDRKNVYVDEVS